MSEDKQTKSILLQVLGISMIIVGAILILVPTVANIFGNNDSDKEIVSEYVNYSEVRDDVTVDDAQEAEDDTEDLGRIGDGISVSRVKAATLSAKEKAAVTKEEIMSTNQWKATNYSPGDIGVGEYEVKLGDTLWEISDAVYGNGKEWNKILEINKSDIGFLPNGEQALIITGQMLVIGK